MEMTFSKALLASTTEAMALQAQAKGEPVKTNDQRAIELLTRDAEHRQSLGLEPRP